MEKYEYQLAPAYSLLYGVAILEQKGASICFLLRYYEHAGIKNNLKISFERYIAFVRQQHDCPESFKKNPIINFKYANNNDVKSKIEKQIYKNYA